MRKYLPIMMLVCALLIFVHPGTAMICSFKNPLIQFGQDPSVVQHEGYYYLVQSQNGQITITKSETITGLGKAEPVPVFTPPPGQAYSYDLWAPELAYLDDSWYIYVAATDAPGNNPTHRMFVLKADTDDPLGSWTMQGKVYDASTDKWAIDGAPVEYNGQLYFVWSGWPGDTGDFPQNTYIAEMSDPLTISGPRYLISEPDQPWERSVAAIQEGQQPFVYEGKLFILYAADASWSHAYKLGLLTLTGDDPLDAASWTKSGPVLEENPDGGVYGVGHSSVPVMSPDGSEYWLLYHAKTLPGDGWGDRSIRADRFTWGDDGLPKFDPPTPMSAGQPLPSGEPCGELIAAEPALESTYELNEAFVDTGVPLVNTLGSFAVVARVQLASTDSNMAIVSQEGGITSNFVLEFADGEFAFTMYEGMGNGEVSAHSSISPTAGEWYHLAGVRDGISNQLLLYVNGELVGTAEFTADWGALGHTIIGGAKRQSKRVGLFSGIIENVQLYNGALEPAEVADLYNQST